MKKMQTNKAEREMYSNRIIKFLCFGLLFLSIISCNKTIDYVEPQNFPNTPIGNFDAFYQGIKDNYMFSNYDNVDWQALYNENRAKITSSTTPQQLLNIISPMFRKLIDGHAYLDAGKYGIISSRIVDANFFKKYSVDTLKDSINLETLIKPAYLKLEHSIYTYSYDNLVFSDQMYTGIIADTKIGYIRVKKFRNALDPLGPTANKSQYVTFDSFINTLNISFYKGIIIDLRCNFGGSVSELYRLLSRFTTSKYTWCYQINRISQDKSLLTPPLSQDIVPNSIFYTGKVVVLTNRLSVSASELFTMALKGNQNITIVGDTTFGATGPISPLKDYTGNFTMPNGWTIQLAQRITLDKNKQMYEGKGVPPDVYIKQTYTTFADNVLDKGIEILSK